MSPPHPLGSSYSYIPELDGVRALSILLVVISHAGLGNIVPGGFGVTLFFGISGFIITRLLLAEHAGTGEIDFGAFYLRRVVRLYPALLVFVALSCLTMLALGVPLRLDELASALFYGANYWRMWLGYSTGIATFPHPYDILWSLAIEEHFYMFFPLFLALALRRGHFLPWVVAAIVASLLWRLAILHGCAPGAWWDGSTGFCALGGATDRIYLGTDTRLDALLYGCLLAWLAARPPAPWVHPVLRHPATLLLAGAMILGSLLYRDPGFRDTWRYSVQSLAILLGMGAMLFSPQLGWVRSLLRLPPLLLIGRMSYVLYLTHWLALGLASYWTGLEIRRTPYPLIWYVICIPLTVVSAMAFYWGVEVPVARLRRRLRPKGVAGGSSGHASPVT